MARELLDNAEVEAGLAALSPQWSGDQTALTRSIEFADEASAARFVSELAPISDKLDHHADLSMRLRWVDIELSTHSAGGVTALDMQLAGEIDELAATLPLA
jgi:4a-hydroxytetrahydrobiopterin dehydratase